MHLLKCGVEKAIMRYKECSGVLPHQIGPYILEKIKNHLRRDYFILCSSSLVEHFYMQQGDGAKFMKLDNTAFRKPLTEWLWLVISEGV